MHKVGAIYYPICLDFKFSKTYMIWVGDDIDGVLLDDNKMIIAFKTKGELIKLAQSSILELKEDITIYDVYAVQQWLTKPNSCIDCELFLNLWNLFTDIAVSLNVLFLGDVNNHIRDSIYDKLFDGSGIFIAEDPDPVFNNDEIKELSDIIQNGFGHLLNNLAIQ